MKKTTIIADGFKNLLKSFGGNNDTRTQTGYTITPRITRVYDLLDDLYNTSWIAGKIVDIPVADAFREGRTLQIEDKNKLDEVLELYTTIDNKIAQALKYARIYGGAVLVIVSSDDKIDKPLKTFSQGDLVNIAVLDVTQIVPQELDRNPLSTNYLKPKSYIINNTSVSVHPSRVIYVDGVETTNKERELNNGFGCSLFERGYKNIEDAVQTTVSIRNLVEQSNLDVVAINNLNDSVASGDAGETAVRERIAVLSQMKSLLNTIAIDGKDTYTNIAKNFGTLDKIQMNMFVIVSAIYDIPYTRFMGKSAEGLSATGDGDLKNYYDKVKADIQVGQLTQIYKILDPIVTKHLFDDDSGFKYEFNPLYQLTELEEAELRSKNATIRASDLNLGIIDEEAALKEAQKDGLYLDYDPDSILGGLG